ncbi:MAG: HNH endonuclease [Patescibacteria group bacterium]|nr:HNH endonuclease [Patescibacteria group bacterium]
MASNHYRGMTDDRLLSMKPVERYRFFREKMWERDRGLCGICGQYVAIGNMDIDHIVPRVEGGPDDWQNLRIAHPSCNRHRGGMLVAARQKARRTRDEIESIALSLILRLPPDLHASLVEWAKADDRSLNGQIVHILRSALEQRGR